MYIHNIHYAPFVLLKPTHFNHAGGDISRVSPSGLNIRDKQKVKTMITKLYATFDKQAKAFNERIFQAPTDEVAIRSVKSSQLHDEFLNNNAEDFSVFCLGTYDGETGTIVAEKRMIHQLEKIKKEKQTDAKEE